MSAPLNGGGSMRHWATRGAVSPPTPRKSRASLRLDAEVLEWFRGQACKQGGGRCQTMTDAALSFCNMSQKRSICLKSVATPRESMDWGATSS
jgi:BrnA antitoxin of type II toxin-antitoxin system